MEFFRRLDRVWARGEGWATLAVLLSMVFVAGFSAGIRNLTRFEVQWANELLTDMEWADTFLRKATMLLAFLGASQATFYRKHISIDVLTRIAPLKQRYMMHAAAGVIAGFIVFGLSYSLASAVKISLAERPIEYEMLGDNGPKHLCEATEAELKNLDGVEMPSVFCAVRKTLGVFGIVAETPGAAFNLSVPFLFLVIGLRFLGIGIGCGMAVLAGEAAMLQLEKEEHDRIAAVHAAVSGAHGDEGEQEAAAQELAQEYAHAHDEHDEHAHQQYGEEQYAQNEYGEEQQYDEEHDPDMTEHLEDDEEDQNDPKRGGRS